MKKCMLVLGLFLVASVTKADDIDDIVKKAITQSVVKKGATVEETSDKALSVRAPVKSVRTDACECGPGCDCDDCKCKPGYKCDCNGCKKLKSRGEPQIERCWVIINDSKHFVVDEMTVSEAMSAIRAQGNKVVFVDANNTVVDPPSWYTGKVALKGGNNRIGQDDGPPPGANVFELQPFNITQADVDAMNEATRQRNMASYPASGGYRQSAPRGIQFGARVGGFQAGACVGKA